MGTAIRHEPRLKAVPAPLSLQVLIATTLAAVIVRWSACLFPAKKVTASSAAQQKSSVVPERSSIASSRMSPKLSPFSSVASDMPSRNDEPIAEFERPPDFFGSYLREHTDWRSEACKPLVLSRSSCRVTPSTVLTSIPFFDRGAARFPCGVRSPKIVLPGAGQEQSIVSVQSSGTLARSAKPGPLKTQTRIKFSFGAR